MCRNLFPYHTSEDGTVGIHPEEVEILKAALFEAERILLDQEVDDCSDYLPLFWESQLTLDFDELTPFEVANFWESVMMMIQQPSRFDKDKVLGLLSKISSVCHFICKNKQ